MAITPAIDAMIIHYCHAEKCSVTSIARTLRVSRTAVNRLLGQAGLTAPQRHLSPVRNSSDSCRASRAAGSVRSRAKADVSSTARNREARPPHSVSLIASRRPDK